MSNASQDSEYTPPDLNEEESVVWQQMSRDARRQLQDHDLRTRPATEGRRVWERLLTDVERTSLGGDFYQAWLDARGTLGIWMRVKGISNRFAALANLVRAYSSLDWLMQQASLVAGTDRPSERPEWNPQTGQLSCAGEQIRRPVRRFRNPSNVQRILGAFQNAGWPTSIHNPLEDVRNQTQLHQAVHQLNQTLRRIRFSVSEGAAVVNWGNWKPEL